MRTETITFYHFDELSEEAQERARDWWRNNAAEYAWMNESRQSLETFCDHFGVKLKSWTIEAYITPDYQAEFSNANFRGLKLRDYHRDYMPTGYCLDCDLWMTFHDEFKRTGDAKAAFDAALWRGFIAWRNDLEAQNSDEYIDDHLTINEYEFTQEGQRA